jgi:chromodomain-helicase-DNA-binding protein 4
MEVDSQEASSSKSTAKEQKSSQQLCEEYGIQNLDIKYTESDFQNLTTYKLFNQHIKPLIMAQNPKLPMSKMVTIIGAKWREFIELKEQEQTSSKSATNQASANSQTQDDTESQKSLEDGTTNTADTEADSEVTGTRKRRPKRPIDYDATEDASGDDEAYGRRTSGRGKRGSTRGTTATPVANAKNDEDKRKSSKTPRKRKKRGEDGGSYNESDAEFEAMLEEQCRIDEAERENKKNKRAAAAAAKTTKSTTNGKTSVATRGGKSKKEQEGYEVVVMSPNSKILFLYITSILFFVFFFKDRSSRLL